MPEFEPAQINPDRLDVDDAEAVGYVERSLAATPVWQMGTGAPQRRVSRPDPNILNFLASARKAPLGELEFDVLTWIITRWYQSGRPNDGRLAATVGELAHALYGRRSGGRQYGEIKEALDGIYNVSLDLSVITVGEQGPSWHSATRRRIIQELRLDEALPASAKRNADTVELQLSSWLIKQLDANVVAAIGWQSLRALNGIAKRLAIMLAAQAEEFEPITEHTERLVIELNDDFYEQLGITAARERQRRQSVAKAAARISDCDSRYTRLQVEPVSGSHVLRAEKPRGARVLPLPGSRR